MSDAQKPRQVGLEFTPNGGPRLVDSFGEVVREYWIPVYRFLYCVTGNSHDAEDLTQETFLRAMSRLDSFRTSSGMRPWLLKIAANAAHDVRRRRGRIAFASLVHDHAASSPDPGHEVEVTEQAVILTKAIEQLTEQTRMVFHLRVQEDLSFREIAELVGTTEQGARWHMHRARTVLMRLFTEKS